MTLLETKDSIEITLDLRLFASAEIKLDPFGMIELSLSLKNNKLKYFEYYSNRLQFGQRYTFKAH